MPLTVSESSTIDAVRAEWEALDARTSPRLPFTGPLWTEVWLRHFLERRAALHDTPRLFTLRDERGVLRAVAPMISSERPGRGPVRSRMLRFVGADPAITEVCGVVAAPEDLDAATLALMDAFAARRGEWDLWLVNGLREGGAAAERAARWHGAEWTRCIPDYLLRLPSDYETFRAGLGRNIKESIRKCYNSLKRDGHAFELRVVTAPADAGAAVERFLALHSARAALDGTVVHRNVFDDPRGRAFLHDCCSAMAERGELRVFQLVIGEAVVATRIGFLKGRSLYLYFSGFDPAWKAYSVMTTTVVEAIRWAIGQGLEEVNLSPGADVSKTRWGPTEVCFHEVLLPAPTLRGALALRAYQALSNPGGGRLGRLASLLRRDWSDAR